MSSQYFREGVLIRPMESLSTNFLSSRFYNGRGIVDFMEDERLAELWFRVASRELGFKGVESVSPGDLRRLVELRSSIERAYYESVSGNFQCAAGIINELTSLFDWGPIVEVDPSGLIVGDSREGQVGIGGFVSIVLASLIFSTSGPRGRRLRKCDGPNCVLFYSKYNEKQHWCSSSCGNRARVARHSNKRRVSEAK